MSRSAPVPFDVLSSITTFGDLLRYLRQRAQLTQRDLALAVGYSISQISRLEHNERLPDPVTIAAVFLPALHLQEEPDLATRLLDLAAHCLAASGEPPALPVSPLTRQQPKGKFALAQPTKTVRPALYAALPDFPFFYGREEELHKMQQWIMDEGCRLVVVLGMGGIGKTALAVTLAKRLQSAFDRVYWISLRNAPSFSEMLRDCFSQLIGPVLHPFPNTFAEQMRLLLGTLQAERTLLILDNAESILQAGEAAGLYRPGYEEYGQCLLQLCQQSHRSCLLLTSRERPQPVGRLERETSVVHVLKLQGLPIDIARQLMHRQGMNASETLEVLLVERYSGNPLALTLVTETVQSLFGGDIAAFLTETKSGEGNGAVTPIFDDIRQVLDQQWLRLSTLEQEIVTWLAVARHPMTSSELAGNLLFPPSSHLFIAALRALDRRSWLEHQDKALTLQNVVMEYSTERLIEQICQEIELEQIIHLQRFALTQATVAEYVHQSQLRMILQPVAERLLKKVGRNHLQQRLRRLLNHLQDTMADQPNYAGGNLLNLCLHLGQDLSKMDFSNLAIWQTDLRRATLHDVNFAGANFRSTRFRDTFGAIYCIAFSADGQYFATGASDFQIRLWHVATQQCSVVLEGHTQYVWGVDFCPTGDRLASCSLDGTVRLWDVHSGQCLQTLQGHTQGVRQVRFSPDGETLASAALDGTVRLWDLKTATCSGVLLGHSGGVNSLAFSPHGQSLVTGGDAFDLHLWDLQTGQLLRSFAGHRNFITTVAFSADGNTIASGSGDQTIHLWDASNGELLTVLTDHADTIHAVAFHQNDTMLISGSGDRTVRLWDLANAQCLKILNHHTSAIWAVAASANGRLIASAGDDKTICLWDGEGHRLLSVLAGYTGSLGRLAFIRQGAQLAAAGADGDVHLWNVANNQYQGTLSEQHGNTRALDVHMQQNLLASGGDDGMVHVWAMGNQQRIATLRGHTKTVRALAFHPNGDLLVSAGDDLAIHLWNIPHQTKVATLDGHQLSLWALAFHPQNALLASAGMDLYVKIWDLRAYQSVQEIPISTGGVRSLTFHRDGRLLAIGSDDGCIRIWDMVAHKIVHQFYGHRQIVHALSFSPDNGKLASASYDKTICLWQLQQGSLVTEKPLVLRGHTNAVLAVAFHPTMPLIASCSMDKTIKLWDETCGVCLATLHIPRPYERMNITDTTGLSLTQKSGLKLLGAVDATPKNV